MALSTVFLAGSAISLIGGLAGAAAQSQSLSYQQSVAQANAARATADASAQEDRQFRNDRRQVASARAAMGSSGLMVDSGSSLSVLSDMAAQQAENRLQIRYGGQTASANASNRATAYGQQATGALLGGATKFAGGIAQTSYAYGNAWS